MTTVKPAFTIQAKAVEKIIRYAATRGVNLDPSIANDPDDRIPFAQLVDLYEKAAQLTGDKNFGLHVGHQLRLTARTLQRKLQELGTSPNQAPFTARSSAGPDSRRRN